MQDAVTARAPVHLWVVAILATLWNAYGCYDYLMTMTNNQAYLAQFPADILAYQKSLPSWLVAFWAIGVWGGLAGSLLLLVGSRLAIWAFGLSLIGAIVGIGYQLALTQRPMDMTRGAMAVIPYAVIVIAGALFFYARGMTARGVLR